MHYISIPVFSLQIHIKMVLHHIPVFIYHLLIGRSRSGNTVRLIFLLIPESHKWQQDSFSLHYHKVLV